MKTNVVNQLFKQKYWIRFELGISGLEEKAYFNEVMQRSYSICNFLFSKNDEVYVINRISYLTTHSLLGGFGRRIEQTAWSFCSSGLIYIGSSDAHHLERRGFRLREAYDAIHERMGEAWECFFLNNAQCVIGNKTFGRMPVEALSYRGVWSRLFSYFQNK
ncbi:DUF3885 domain-containing protein [Paenibacillus sp. LPE1-1-1.1]|uniref:DUF3885 domain-containing protein n=1 Tax=Paenibacillus sp. LPE1-1-1.1 TaxID=3135230 RepID=UPI003426B6FB